MAVVKVPTEDRVIEDVAAIRDYLAPHGIWYENWDVGQRCGVDATNEEILAAYDPEIRRLMASGGYHTADVINVTPDVPNLDQMLAKFSKEHTHSEDEVRFIVKGRGIFHIHPATGPVFAIQVEAGDLINVPQGTRHWFDLCEDRTIRAIRLFQDMSGWTPEYVPDGVHEQYAPLCWGPNYLPAGTAKVQSLSI
jgi:1,2-dihydroxy-3-keto-5-methylthiopentene dioxygenase